LIETVRVFWPTPTRSPHAGGRTNVMMERTEKTQQGSARLMT